MELTTERGYRMLDAIARARRPRDIIDAVLECLAAHGLRGSWGQLRGDEVLILDLGVPDDDAARIEEMLGVPIGAMRFPLAAYPSLGIAVGRRTSTVEDAFPSRMISMFPHLTDVEKAAVRRHLGPGPLLAAPIGDGDALLGVLFAWGPSVVSQRTLVETLAALAGFAWHRVEEREDALPAPSEAAIIASSDLGDGIRELLVPGGIRAALQPLVRLGDRTVLGYEALCRFTPRHGLGTPDELFAGAPIANLKREVDEACLVAAFAAAPQTAPATLFVNVAVETLVEGRSSGDRLSRLADIAGISASDVVLEVSERTPVGDLNRLRRVVADLRQRGFRIAIDDAGAGHASMLVIAEVQPEFVKIDRLLIHGLDVSAARRALVVSLLSFGAHINARVIAEGIETEDELQTLLSLGVQFGQGWLLGRPVMVAPPADAGSVVEVAADWFSKQRAAPFRTTVVDVVPDHSGGGETAARTARRGRTALPRALINAATALQSEHDPARIFEVIAEQLQTVVPVDGVYIYAADEGQNRFVPVYATEREAEARMAYGYSMDLGVNGWAFKLGIPRYVRDVSAHPATITIPGTPVGAPESYLIIPLIAGDRRLGVLDCSRLGIDRFTSRDLEAAALFGHTAAAAWRNAELYRELSERAITDPLTGLLNSRWLRDVGERELAQSLRSGESLAILLLDLDRFKQINDTGGHSAGDLVLRRVAAAFRDMIRSGDAAVRLGGEEFLLLLRNADATGAERIAVEARNRLAALRLPRSCLPLAKLTVSTGIAVMPHNGTVLKELIRAADVAMYEAKRAGGDRHQLSTHRPEKRRTSGSSGTAAVDCAAPELVEATTHPRMRALAQTAQHAGDQRFRDTDRRDHGVKQGHRRLDAGHQHEPG
jgi:diguanylate cyclase (GGDEF)-like protein